jgi:hypothetical protein
MKDWEAIFERLIWSFSERDFLRYIKGFLVDSKRLLEEMESKDLQLVSEYIPQVFWKKLKGKNFSVYAIDQLLNYFFGDNPERTSLEGAENLLVLNTLFWERFQRKSYRKGSRIRPSEEYYMRLGAYFYRLSYLARGSSIFKVMEIHYRPLVEELRKLKR